jgi:hypothetical protein
VVLRQIQGVARLSRMPLSSRLTRAQINWPWRTTAVAALAGVALAAPVMMLLSGSVVAGLVLACAFGVFVGVVVRFSAAQTASAYPPGTDPADFEEIRRIVRTGAAVREVRLAAPVLHLARRILSVPFAPKTYSCAMAVVALLGLTQVVLGHSLWGLAQAILFGVLAVALPPQVRRQRQRAREAANHALAALGLPPDS